jgi:hypothetical protein
VLTDLMTYDGKQAPRKYRREFHKRVIFDPMIAPLKGAHWLEVVIMGGDDGTPPTHEERKAVLQAVQDSKQRDERVQPERHVLFNPAHPNISLWKSDRNQWEPMVSATFPGYSNTEQIAVVQLTFTWAVEHDADGVYLLKRKNGKWQIQRRYFLYYT